MKTMKVMRLGYYNCEDAVYLAKNDNPDHAVECMKNGYGAFYKKGTEEEITLDDNTLLTKDGKYVVKYDVDEFLLTADLSEDNIYEDTYDAFVDIYEVRG